MPNSNISNNMTRGLFLTQYKGEWAPSDDLWLGMDFSYAGSVFRFQTDAMYKTHNLILEDGREARFYMYKQNKVMDSVKYDMIGAYATTEEVLSQCLIDGESFGAILDSGLIELLGQD